MGVAARRHAAHVASDPHGGPGSLLDHVEGSVGVGRRVDRVPAHPAVREPVARPRPEDSFVGIHHVDLDWADYVVEPGAR